MYRIEELSPSAILHSETLDEELAEQAIADPSFDYFSNRRGNLWRPKAEIGSYVAEHGFSVPLITTAEHWQRAFDNGVAMIRSESTEEYSGYRGMFSSPRIGIPEIITDEREPMIAEQIAKLALQGLRNGEINPVDYMKYYYSSRRTWSESLANIYQRSHWFNVQPNLDMPKASLWEYVPGANVSIFGDPHIEGRYYTGFTEPRSENRWPSTGGFVIEPDQHSEPQLYRKHDVEFVAEPFIEMYERIAALPLFDTQQRPVMEFQMASDGLIHFLQYYKTNQRSNYHEPFDISFDPEQDIKTDMVRGITPAGGKNMRLFVTPHRYEKAMQDQAIYCDLLRPNGFEIQLISKLAGFILQRTYISFEDGHLNSAPLFMPPLAAGLIGITEDSESDLVEKVGKRLQDASLETYHDSKNIAFFDIHVTSNGREATIRSDWEPRYTTYKKLG